MAWVVHKHMSPKYSYLLLSLPLPPSRLRACASAHDSKASARSAVSACDAAKLRGREGRRQFSEPQPPSPPLPSPACQSLCCRCCYEAGQIEPRDGMTGSSSSPRMCQGAVVPSDLREAKQRSLYCCVSRGQEGKGIHERRGEERRVNEPRGRRAEEEEEELVIFRLRYWVGLE